MAEKRTIRVVHERHPSDSYNTPPKLAKFAVDHAESLIQKYAPDKKVKSFRMLEPGCGDGAPFARYASWLGHDAYAVDIRSEALNIYHPTELERPLPRVLGYDFLKDPTFPKIWPGEFDLIVTNPPFKFGQQFIDRSISLLSETGVAAFLVKMNFLGTRGRMKFFKTRSPSEVHILSQRPSFAHKATDRMQEYCFIFYLGTWLDKKVRRNRGGVPRIYWQDNKSFDAPVYCHTGDFR